MPGCQQVNDMVNGNKATNSNTSANTNANSNANSNVTANSNANANTLVVPSNSAANANSQASNTATAPKEEVPLTPEAKVFKNDLVGEWAMTDDRQRFKFTENKLVTKDGTIHTYRVVDEKTLELTRDEDNYPWKTTMTIKDDGNTLIWHYEVDLKFTRVKPN